ncbi:MAG TPA: hypothetical protein VJU58_13860 [Microbacterium sp.]|nr:hypothetical protein [Microbacterium sp.]
MDDSIKEIATSLRKALLEIEHTVRAIKEHPEIKTPDAYPGQHGEMIAQSMLALRAIEEARMRLGKVLQYGRDGVSVYDRTEAP